MKINPLNFALALGSTAAGVWIICSLLVWIMPGAMMSITGQMVHLDMGKIGWVLSPVSFLWGLVEWSLFAGVFAWSLARIYNLLARN